MRPTFEQFHAFLVVAETGHFTRAAERLGISQSALSASIQRLESLLGTRLFERHTRGCRLSDAGLALQPLAQRFAHDWDHLLDEARDLALHGHRRLAIAAPTAQCALLLPPLIRTLTGQLPGLRVTVHDVGEQQVHALVRAGVADLGIATQTDARTDLISTPFYSDQYVLALPPEHPLARRKTVEWALLRDVPVIGPLADNPVRRHLDQRLVELGYALNYRYEVSLPWTMVGLVREGLGLSVLTRALQPLIEWHQLAVRPIGRPTIVRTLVLLRSPVAPLSPPASAFRQLLIGAPDQASRDA